MISRSDEILKLVFWNTIEIDKINTLDALNVWLAQKLPLLSGGVAGASLLEASAQELY